MNKKDYPNITQDVYNTIHYRVFDDNLSDALLKFFNNLDYPYTLEMVDAIINLVQPNTNLKDLL